MDEKKASGPETSGQKEPGAQGAGAEVVHRVLVSAPTPEGKLALASLSLLRHGEAYTLNQRLGPKNPPELAQALDQHLTPLKDPSRKGTPAEARWKEALGSMQSAGWSVEEITGDLEVNLTFDGRTGKVLAKYRPLHALADADPRANAELTQAARASLATLIETNAREHASLVIAALQEGRWADASKLLEEGTIHFLLYPQRPLLEALRRVAPQSIAPADAVALLEARLQLSEGLRDSVGLDRDLAQLLALTGKDKDPQAMVHLLLARANAAGQKQLRESAMALFRDVIQATSSTDTLSRAWAYRGMALNLEEEAPARWSYEEQAMDAFLMGGNTREAINSAVAIARVRVRTAPDAALALLGNAMQWASRSDPLGGEFLAALHHERAEILRMLNRFQEARAAAEQAAELRRGLFGSELARVASLELAAHAAEQSGDEAAAKELAARAETEHGQLPNPDADLERRFFFALKAEGWPGIEKLRAAIESSENARLQGAFLCMEACLSLEKSFAERLELLDAATLLASKQPPQHAAAIRLEAAIAFARVYESKGDLEKALEWHQKVLGVDPFEAHTIGRVAFLLLRLERWSEAIAFAQNRVERVGRKPGWLVYLGRAQLKAGHPQEAFVTLKEAEGLTTDPETLAMLRKLKEEALHACAEPPAPPLPPPPPPTVTREQFESVLRDFASYVASEKRMSFWRAAKEGKGHDWTPRPEQLAKHLLQTFLKGRFGAIVESLEELMVGAGRIDLYLIFSGGLRIVVELKMCGNGYSTQYALEGVEQLVHYLEQKGTSLGYLIVFDGRIDSFGTGILVEGATGSKVIIPLCVDVRPKVKAPVPKSVGKLQRKRKRDRSRSSG